ncbi:hypothetical protein AB0M02_40530 [Actinoplanes sp. NPDC051861]|uniref:hypothetical protein n=1 Tax=Actinoplanes sp. NPDC051861 TaxID=3155170 RepID=UPI00341238EC
MTDHNGRRAPRRGRARKRAIRAQAARAGVAYSVAARQLEAAGLRPGETIASYGRTVYPAVFDRRTFEQRRDDTRRAAILPAGRAAHLVERFPPCGELYSGEGRAELLSLLYLAIAERSPHLVPALGDLAWTAEMGEASAVDLECAALDREARELLERDPATSLTLPPNPPIEGARQILDALLVIANDGHAPGTRVRMLASPFENRLATITGAVWGAPGPPVAYRVLVDGLSVRVAATPGELIVLAGQ